MRRQNISVDTLMIQLSDLEWVFFFSRQFHVKWHYVLMAGNVSL